VIRLEAGMPTARFVRLVGVPERSYRRWQHMQRHGQPARGPWPAPAQDRVEPVAVSFADRYPAWGHRKLAELIRVDVSGRSTRRCCGRCGAQDGCCRSTTRPNAVSTQRRGGQRSWCHRRHRISVARWTSPSSRHGWAASDGSAGSRTTGRSSSSAGTSRQQRTTATRSRHCSRQFVRPNGYSAKRCPSCSSTTRVARSGRSRW